MVIYSINDVENLTGVKAHTIRIWEKRYDLLPCRRTDSNIRFYLEEDLQLLTNIALLNRNGIKISKIATMTNFQIKEKVANFCKVNSDHQDHLDAYMISIIETDYFKLNKLLNTEIAAKGFEQTMEDTIYPLLDKLYLMCMTGCINSVHDSFFTNMIHQKLIVELEKLNCKHEESSKSFLLFQPESESHQLSLLYTSYILKKEKASVLYLGNTVQLADLQYAIKNRNVDYILTIANEITPEFDLQNFIFELKSICQEIKVLLMGYCFIKSSVDLPINFTIVDSVSEIKALI